MSVDTELPTVPAQAPGWEATVYRMKDFPHLFKVIGCNRERHLAAHADKLTTEQVERFDAQAFYRREWRA